MNTALYDFSTASDYTLDDTTISSGKSMPALLDESGIDFAADIPNSTYDSDYAELVDDVLMAKSFKPENSTFGATFNSVVNGSFGGGTLTGTAYGTAAISDNWLTLINSDVSYVAYSAVSNADFQTQGCIKFKVKPNYSGIPSSQKYFFSITSGTIQTCMITCYHSTDGNLWVLMNTDSVPGSGFVSWSPVSGTEYIFELNIDLVGGTSRLFINGALSITISKTGTRTTAMTVLKIGTDYNASASSNISIKDFVVFSTVQHTAAHTSDYDYDLYDTTYLETSIVCPELAHSGPGTLISLDSISSTFSGSPRFSLQIGRSGYYLYYDGESWVTSDGSYDEANSFADMSAAIASLYVTGQIYGQLKIHFPASDTQATITAFAFSLTAQLYALLGTTKTGPFYAESISSVSATYTEESGSSLKFIMYAKGTPKYYNGTAWVTSDLTAAQSNTYAVLSANISTLISKNSTVAALIVHVSDDGTAKSEISELSFIYDFGGVGTDPDKCVIWGYYKDISGTGVNGATVTINLVRGSKEYKEAVNNIIAASLTVTTGATTTNPDWEDGYFEITLIRQSEYEGTTSYVIKITDSANEIEISKDSNGDLLTFDAPDADEQDITELLTST